MADHDWHDVRRVWLDGRVDTDRMVVPRKPLRWIYAYTERPFRGSLAPVQHRFELDGEGEDGVLVYREVRT